jgi:hypothetical protein
VIFPVQEAAMKKRLEDRQARQALQLEEGGGLPGLASEQDKVSLLDAAAATTVAEKLATPVDAL